jgi:hypothetical protein
METQRGQDAGQELGSFPFELDLANLDGVTYEAFRDAIVAATLLGMNLAQQNRMKELAAGVRMVDAACDLFPDYAARMHNDPIYQSPETYL